MMRNPEQTIGTLIDKQGVSFIGSVDADGFPNMKAMLPPRKREGIKVFWFTTNTSSMRVAQYRANPNACVCFYDKSIVSPTPRTRLLPTPYMAPPGRQGYTAFGTADIPAALYGPKPHRRIGSPAPGCPPPLLRLHGKQQIHRG